MIIHAQQCVQSLPRAGELEGIASANQIVSEGADGRDESKVFAQDEQQWWHH
jgi:hypothetical protein